MSVHDAAAAAHATGRVYQQRLAEALDLTRHVLSVSAEPYISFSCGKDSTVLADIVLSVNPSIPMRFLSSGETRLLHNVDDVLGYFVARGAHITEICVDRVFSDGWADAGWNESRTAGDGDLQNLHADHHDCAFIGMRAEESAVRRMSLYGCRTDGLPLFLYRTTSGRLRACPLAKWRLADIHAHIVSRGLPLLHAYHEDGIGTRTTARLTGTSVRMGTLRRLREHHLDQYNAIIRRWPELASIQ